MLHCDISSRSRGSRPEVCGPLRELPWSHGAVGLPSAYAIAVAAKLSINQLVSSNDMARARRARPGSAMLAGVTCPNLIVPSCKVAWRCRRAAKTQHGSQSYK